MEATRTRRLGAAEVEFEVVEAGTGGRPLLLVHGFGGAKEDFVEHLPALAEAGWHSVAPDLRGHGASDAPAEEEAYALEVLASDLVALADALGWDRFALLGHSMGGMAAQLAALAVPERIAALVLMATSHGPVEVDRSLALASIEIVRSGGMPALAEAITALGGSPFATPQGEQARKSRPSPLGGDDIEASWAAFADAKLIASSPAMYTAMVPAMLDQPDRLHALEHLQVPTLVVVGEHDASFLQACRRLAATIPGARLVVVAGAGHSPQHEAPEAWRHSVLSFLEKTVAQGG
ncbi:MAG TPA: alpha/beta hydrolase [Acidimicrobiales bacterium]|nr:alpha/beta hydrolase [Acidimicrobiales bacterium]